MKKINPKGLSLLLITSFLPLLILSQKIKPLTVGDKMPEVLLSQMVNYAEPSATTSDFKGKALILDFWFRECTGCVEAMPHLDSIQKKFSENLQLLLVTFQGKSKIEEFWKTNWTGRKLKFTQVVGDTILSQLFPARSFPHQIWINKNREIVAITNGEATNEQNIAKLIAGDKFNLEIKNDEMNLKVMRGVDPLINIYYEERKKDILQYSYLSKYRKEFAGQISWVVDSVNKLARFTAMNIDFLSLYDCAYSSMVSNPDLHRPTRIIREDSNPIPTKADYIDYSNVFCYDLIFQGKDMAEFGKHMIGDLDNYFNVKSLLVKREMPCYIIRQYGDSKKYQQALAIDANAFVENRKFEVGKKVSVNKYFMGNYNLIHVLNSYSDKPFIIEIDGNYINFEVIWDLQKLDQMNIELHKYGLEILVENRVRDLIILRDK